MFVRKRTQTKKKKKIKNKTKFRINKNKQNMYMKEIRLNNVKCSKVKKLIKKFHDLYVIFTFFCI